MQRGYDAVAQAEPERIVRIDAARGIEAVFGDVRAAVDRLLDARGE